MPHYGDGTPASVGDFVVGKPYNTDHEVTGLVLEVKPGSTCNLILAFIETEIPHASQNEPCATYAYPASGRIRLRVRTDYGETSSFLRLRADERVPKEMMTCSKEHQ